MRTDQWNVEKMKNTIKVLLFYFFLIACATLYQKVDLGGAYSNAHRDNINATSDGRKQDTLDQAGRLRSFLFLYCRAYESKDLEKFSSFFAPDATENNKAFHDFLPRYRRNFERIELVKYRIDLDSYSIDTDTSNIILKGKYFIQYLLKGGTWKENNGIISMELIKSGNSYLVKQLNYSFLSLE